MIFSIPLSCITEAHQDVDIKDRIINIHIPSTKHSILVDSKFNSAYNLLV